MTSSSSASGFGDFRPVSAHVVLPPSSEPAAAEVVAALAEDKPASSTSTKQQSLCVLEGGTSELKRNELREGFHSSHKASESEPNPIRAPNQRLSGIDRRSRAPAAAAATVGAASNSSPTAQQLQRQRDPRDVQAVFHALVSHMLRVEPSQEPAFALNVTSITTCSIIVQYNQTICSFLNWYNGIYCWLKTTC